jgi:hypothetical protein
VLLKPLTYPEPEQIVQFLSTSPNRNSPGASITKFHNWQEQGSVFQDVAAYDFGGPGFNLTGSVPEQIHGIHVTHDYFALFGAPIELGRSFIHEKDRPNGGHVVVLSDGLWRRMFGGDPNVGGTSISLGGDRMSWSGLWGIMLRLIRPRTLISR